MRQFTTIAGLRRYLELHRFHSGENLEQGGDRQDASHRQQTVGLVPTMGALHAGHISLIRRARLENHLVVVSIFVNPLQFAPNEDLQRYPRTPEHDHQLCADEKVDVIFTPTPAELYGTSDISNRDRLTQVVPPAEMMAVLCGRSRPGHFQGVATVVTKLLSIVQPDRAYFGQKDAQQLAILQQLVHDLNIPVEIVPCSIVRNKSGLALSSRNDYLTAEEKERATVLSRSLNQAKHIFSQGVRDRSDLLNVVKMELSTEPTVRVDYVDLVHPQTLAPLEQIDESGLLAIAVYLGSTRLIDNIVLRNRKPIIAIDGPAGAGKSTVARLVARKLDLLYLDSGAMYRAVTWLALKSGLDSHDEPGIAELTSQCHIQIAQGEPEPDSPLPGLCRVWVNGHDVTHDIRSADVTAHVSAIAAQPAVREELVKQQQYYGREGGVVMDGRDIGTHVFPHAELKIYLTASVQERARRRQQDLKDLGQPDESLEDLERTIYQRDYRDSTRAIAPLRKAPDAVEIETDTLSVDDVVDAIIELCASRCHH